MSATSLTALAFSMDCAGAPLIGRFRPLLIFIISPAYKFGIELQATTDYGIKFQMKRTLSVNKHYQLPVATYQKIRTIINTWSGDIYREKGSFHAGIG